MSIETIISLITSAIAGGGISWFLMPRMRFRREGGKLQEQEFDAVSKIVKAAMSDLHDLSQRIAELEKEKTHILKEMSELRKENEKLDMTLRRYIREKNPNL